MNPQDILKAVNDFYQQAWDKLIIFSGVMVGVVGIIVPLFFTWLQNKNQKIREDLIKKELEGNFNAQMEKIKEELVKSVEEKINKSLEEINKKIETRYNVSEARTFHIQAISYIDKKNYKQALSDLTTSGENYLDADDFLNLGRINNMIISTLKSITKGDLELLKEEEGEPDDYLKILSKKNEKGVFDDIISEIKKNISAKLKDKPA